jgi:hypothetical protein
MKLDAKAEAHKTSSYKYDKLQSECEFFSGKLLFFASKDDDIDNTNVDDLNKMANSGKKKYKSKSKSLNLLENFEQDKCNNTCSIKKSNNKKKSFLNSDNIIIILLLIVITYLFYNKK